MSAVTALLLVDLQQDFLDSASLEPPRQPLIDNVARLLNGFRLAGAPIAHIRTIVCADGSDAMPHWRQAGILRCVQGSPGAAPPEALRELPGELVATKQHFRGFAGPRLDLWLRRHHVATVVIAGVYAHACVHETVLDAYERGYEVIVAADGVATDDARHGAISRQWLEGRAARYHPIDALLAPGAPQPAPP